MYIKWLINYKGFEIEHSCAWWSRLAVPATSAAKALSQSKYISKFKASLSNSGITCLKIKTKKRDQGLWNNPLYMVNMYYSHWLMKN